MVGSERIRADLSGFCLDIGVKLNEEVKVFLGCVGRFNFLRLFR